jgi:TRAP transporter TAXI family solute receptor
MKPFSLFVLACGGLLFAVALVGYLFFSWRPATLRIAVGPPGSEDVKVIQEVAEAFQRERHYVRLRVIVTAGAVESAAAIGAHQADLAVARADLTLPPNALSVAVFRKNVVVLWVPNLPLAKGQKKEPTIKKIEDLSGRRVGVIGKTQANVNLLKLILTEAGVAPEKVNVVQFGTGEIGEALKNDRVDAFLAVGPVDSKITADAIAITTRAGSSPTFLPITSAEIIARKHPVYESSEIAAGALGASPARPDDDVTTLEVDHLVVARKEIHEATITAFTKQLFAIRHRLQTDFPGVANIQVPDTDKAAAIPAHPGAAAYIDGTERTFLERYSDFFWLGLMAVSGVASAGAWFRSYTRRDERARNAALRGRLLDMITAVRDSDSVADIDRMQREADDILRDTLGCFEDGAVDEDTLSAFNIALDQFHTAVQDRKGWISDTAAPRRTPAQRAGAP